MAPAGRRRDRAGAAGRGARATPRTTGLGLVFALCAGLWLTLVGLLPVLLVRGGLALPAAAMLGAGVVAVNAADNLDVGWLAARGWTARGRVVLGFAVLLAGLPFALLDPVTARGTAPGADAVPATTGWMLQWSAAGQIALPPLLASLLLG